jgi:lysozyme
MPISAYRGTAFAVLLSLLAGCTSSGIDGLDIAKSAKVDPSQTASIRPLVPPTRVDVAGETAPSSTIESSSELGFAADKPQSPVELAVIRAEEPARATASDFRKPKVYKATFTDAKPINFGRLSPRPFEVHGVDVSRWQGDIDWQKLRRDGANFAFIKATDGGDHTDPNFRRNWNAAREAGVPRGAYHFFYWCRVASEQADWFIRNVPKEKGALPPVIDVEWNHTSRCKKRPSPEVVREKMQVFMDRLEAHYGQRPIIYTAPDFYDDNLRGAFKDYPFWLRSVAAHPSKVYPNRDFLFWQYSGTGLAASHDTRIDLNVFNGSEAGWHKWLARSIH